MTTEEKARAYAEKAYYPAPEYGWYESDHEAMTDVFEQAYLTGATEALASQWVSVEEELPEDMVNVLVHCSDADPELSDCIAYLKNMVWCFLDDFYIGCTVSHWMPIPIPPLKGGDA